MDLAAVHNLSHTWIRVLQTFVAAAYLCAQNRMLGRLVEAARQPPFAFALRRLAFDETGQRLTLSVPGASAQQQRSVWHVMVGRVTVMLGLRNSERVLVFDLVLPQLLVVSTSAEHIHNQVAPMFAAMRRIGQCSDVCIELDETDAAPGNARLYAHHLQQSNDRTLKCHKLCSSHRKSMH